MQYRILGRTGLNVSLISLGTGGHSRIGQSTGKTPEQSIAIVRKALDRGINLIDSSEAYRTEHLVGEAIAGIPRDRLILSTKASIRRDGTRKTGAQLEESLQASLDKLGTDYVDVYHMHGVAPEDYSYVRRELVPVLEKMKEKGTIRFTGITEAFASDPGHATLQKAVLDDCWDVFMVGFNILNQSARDRVLGPAMEKGIGILDMFAVRRAFSKKENLTVFLRELIAQNRIDGDRLDLEDPLGSVLRRGNYRSLTEMAYRFCATEPGIHSILSGTGEIDHLEHNIDDILNGPMPDGDRTELITLFERVDSESGN